MASSDTNAGDKGHSAARLPLFRPEALAAQQKTSGEILLIRPFSLLFLGWVGIGVAAAVFSYLLLAHYTERERVPAFLTPHQEVALSSHGPQLDAVFYSPGKWLPFLQPGESLSLYCQSCPDPNQRLLATVMQVARAHPAGETLAQAGPEQNAVYKVTLAIPSQVTPPMPSATRLWVVVPLGEKRLIHWLFEQPAR